MVNDILRNYKSGFCKAVNEVFDDILNEIDNELIELEEDIQTGKFSNEEIAERINELRTKIY